MFSRRVLVPAPVEGMAEQPVRTALRIGPQAVGDVHGQDEAFVGRLRLRKRGERLPQPANVDAAVLQGRVYRSVPTAVVGKQSQINWRSHQTVRTQQRVRQLEQFVTARVCAGVEVEGVPEV